MSSSDSDSDSDVTSSNCSAGWPWQCGGRPKQTDSDESDSSSESSSDESKHEETTNDSWTSRKNIFISVYNSDNFKNTTLITNYNELHSYRQQYSKLSKKSADNIKNIWSQVKVNIPNAGIVSLKAYEKELIEDPKNKNKSVKKPTSMPKQNQTVVDSIKPTVVRQNQNSKATQKPVTSNQVHMKVIAKACNKTCDNAANVANKNLKENNINEKIKSKDESNQKKIAEALTKGTKSTEGNKTTTASGSTKVDEKEKGAKADLVVLNVTKSESEKKNAKTQLTKSIKLNESDKNVTSSSNELEFKKPQSKSDSNKNKTGKNNSKRTISATKSRKKKKKNSSSQSSENSDTQKRSSSVDSSTKAPVKKKAKKKIEESDNDTTNNEDESEEIIDNMDALTGNSKVINNEMFELTKPKYKKKPVETPKTLDKKINLKNNNEQSVAESPVKNDLNSSTSEKNYIFHSEKYAEDSVDMMMENNLMGGLESLVEAMQYNPGDDRHYLNRCYCYLRLNKPSLALADAQYLLQTSSHYGHRFIAYLRAGQASMALQKYTQAENYLKDSLSIHSDNLYAQREYMRAKISRIVSLGYTERNAVLALLKYSKTQEAINYLANKNFVNNKDESDDCNKSFDYTDDSDDLVYSSDEDEKPNCTTLINNMMNYEPAVTKLFHLLAKPVNLSTSTLVPSNKSTNGDNKKKNSTNTKSNTGRVMDKALWVGSLKKDMTEAVLKKYFKQFGTIISVYCPPNEAYGFVNFEKNEHVLNVLKNPSPHEINGVKLAVREGTYKK